MVRRNAFDTWRKSYDEITSMGELNMPTQISMKIIPAVLLAALSGTAAASGFQLLEQGSGLGNAYAGSAAKSTDASTIFWNPAGMTQLQAREVSGGLTAVRPSFKFDDNGSHGWTDLRCARVTAAMRAAGAFLRMAICPGR
jgi:long-subunit fatty acid transport protein